MKRTILTGIVVLIVISCNIQDKNSSIEGGWKLVQIISPSAKYNFPDNISGLGVKAWTKGTFVFSGEYKADTAKIVNFGWGTYTLTEGNHYAETIIHHQMSASSEGKTFNMLIEVKNDTLIQQWPVDETWKLKENHTTEKFIRLK